MAFIANDRDEEPVPLAPRSLAPPPRDNLLDRDVVSLCARQRHLLELAFRLADNGHAHVGNLIALSRYTLLDIADGDHDQVDGLERLLSHLGLALETPDPAWIAPRPDLIDVHLD